MVRVKEDLVGKTFGRLTVVRQCEDYVSPKGSRKAQWECQCSCGNLDLVKVVGRHLKTGNTNSCGCYQKDRARETQKSSNKYERYDNYIIGYDSNGEEFYIDAEDFDKIKDFCWIKNKNGYFTSRIGKKTIWLHRIIMDCPSGMVVDHIGGSDTKNDNRKQNLRICTNYENGMNCANKKNNTSGVSGVHWEKNARKWCVRIRIKGKRVVLGRFESFDEAVKVRKEAEEKYFGEWSYDNSQKLYKENNKGDEGEVA